MQDTTGATTDAATSEQTSLAKTGWPAPLVAILGKVKSAYRYAKKLREILLVIVFYITFAPFAEPTVEVTYQLDRLYPPIGAETLLKNATEADDSADAGKDALSRLVRSRDILHLSMRNNSSERIEDLDIQLDGFEIADVALRSNSSEVMADRERLARFAISDNFTARFSQFRSIPPKAEVEMIFWGDFHTLRLGGPVRVSAATKNVSVVRQGTVSGLRLFVARNMSWLAVICAVGLLLLGLRRFR